MKTLLVAIAICTVVGCRPETPIPPRWEVVHPSPCMEMVMVGNFIHETRDLQHGVICVRLSNGWGYDVTCVNVEPTCTVRAGKAVMIDGS